MEGGGWVGGGGPNTQPYVRTYSNPNHDFTKVNTDHRDESRYYSVYQLANLSSLPVWIHHPTKITHTVDSYLAHKGGMPPSPKTGARTTFSQKPNIPRAQKKTSVPQPWQETIVAFSESNASHETELISNKNTLLEGGFLKTGLKFEPYPAGELYPSVNGQIRCGT